jgi:ubiquinone/menaquinone biosynthesis C-methylase UbiE
VNDLRIDGLTPSTLQSSSKSWWDGLFTRLLLDAIPLDTRQIVEIDCGLAAAAHTLLPSLPEARYLGTDFNPTRLADAKAQMEGARVAPRMELRLAPAANVPLEDGKADVVLSIMSLQHIADLPQVLAEASRVLRPGGRFVAVEPDNPGQRFYFDGVLEEINQVMHALCLKARVARQPADIAVGPRLPGLLRTASYHDIRMVAHVVHSSRMETANAFFTRLRRVASTVAQEAGLDPEDEAVATCEQAINRALFADIPKRLGYSSHIVPVFLCVGLKA